MLLPNTDWRQHETSVQPTVSVIVNAAVPKTTSDTFHGVGKTLESVANPSKSKGPQWKRIGADIKVHL